MRSALTIAAAVLALLAAGCHGHAAPSPAGSSPTVTTGTSAVVAVTVSRPIGPPLAERGRVEREPCPWLAECRAVKTEYGHPRLWQLQASRRLTCRPDGGDYPDPGRACAALRLLLHPPRRAVVCFCPMIVAEDFRIDGRVGARAVHRRSDACSLGCGAPPPVAAAVRVLFGT